MGKSEGAWRGAALRALCVAFHLVSIASTVQFSAAQCTTFSVNNTGPTSDGGKRYTAEMGDAWTIQMLKDVRVFILKAFSLSPVKLISHVTFVVEDSNFNGAYNTNNGGEIHVGAKFLAGIQGNLRFEMNGLMFHELGHSFQNNRGNYGTDPHFTGMIEGIATYLELVAGMGVGPKTKGGNWFGGYHQTAHFLAWIDLTQKEDFVNILNQKMGQADWNDVFFKDITGKDVNTLWASYQASF